MPVAIYDYVKVIFVSDLKHPFSSYHLQLARFLLRAGHALFLRSVHS